MHRAIFNIVLGLLIYALVLIQQSPLGGALYDSFSILLLPVVLTVLFGLVTAALWIRGRPSDDTMTSVFGVVVGIICYVIIRFVRDEEGVLLINDYMGLTWALVLAGALTCFNVAMLVRDERHAS